MISANTPLVNLSEQSLMTAAQYQTGLSDWGNSDFREGLSRLLDACQYEANLSLAGLQWLQQECIQSLSNRLYIQEALKKDPEILQVPIRRPLILATLPRSGSTFLHRLLAQDPGGRALLHWELQQPAPPPQVKTYATDSRIAQGVEAARKEQALFSGSKTMHTVRATIPEECCYLLKNSFSNFDATFWYHIPSYYQWLCESDLTNTYRYYKKQLQILTRHFPGEPFVLKEPGHLLGLDAILTVFPDACLVQVHRSPYQQIASLCSLQGKTQNALRHTPLTPHEIGQIVLNRWLIPLKKAMQARSEADPSHFYDIYYEDLLVDPIATVSQLYNYFGFNLSEEAVTQMQVWLDNNPQDKHGKHQYTLKQFGLSPELIDEKMSDYMQVHHSNL